MGNKRAAVHSTAVEAVLLSKTLQPGTHSTQRQPGKPECVCSVDGTIRDLLPTEAGLSSHGSPAHADRPSTVALRSLLPHHPT